MRWRTFGPFAGGTPALPGGGLSGADYALDSRTYYKLDVLADINVAEAAIDRFMRVEKEARRSFAAHVLFRRR